MKFKSILVTILAVSSLILAAASPNNSDFENYGQYIKSLKVSEKSDASDFISDSRIKMKTYFIEHLAAEPLSKNDAKKLALETLLQDKALMNEAAKLNLTATEQEALDVSLETWDFMKNEADTETVIQINQLIKGLNITEEEYWTSYIIPYYVEGITINNLKKHVIGNEQTELAISKWNEYRENVTSKFKSENSAKIEELKKVHEIN